MEMACKASHCWTIGPNTYLADSGASSHMGPGASSMFDIETKPCTIKVGDGNMLNVVQVGKRRCTLQPTNGPAVDMVLDKYKQVEGLL